MRAPLSTPLLIALAPALLVGLLLWPLTRPLAAIGLVLVLPGWLLLRAVDGRRQRDPIERILYGVALSLALVTTIGLLLHLSPWGLTTPAWWWSLGIVTNIAALVSLARAGAPVLPHRWLPARPTLGGGLALFGFALAAVITAGSVRYAREHARQVAGPELTQLWVQETSSIGRPAVRLGVRNLGTEPTRYRLLLRFADAPPREWPSLWVAAGASWEVTEPFVKLPPVGPVEVELYRADQPTRLERHVWLWPSPLLAGP